MSSLPEKSAGSVVLIAVDESAAVPCIIKFVAQHKWDDKTIFKIVNVIAPTMLDHPMASYPLFLESVEKDVRDDAESLLKRTREEIQAKFPDLLVQTEVIAGSPAEVIVAEAERSGAELIIVGSHGRSGLKRFLLGSVSSAVIAHAPCNVMVVRVVETAKSESEVASK